MRWNQGQRQLQRQSQRQTTTAQHPVEDVPEYNEVETGSQIHSQIIGNDVVVFGKIYIPFIAYTAGRIDTIVEVNGTDYVLRSASFTGFSSAQATLYVKNVGFNREGSVGTIVTKNLFELIENIINIYNGRLGIPPRKSGEQKSPEFLDNKLFSVEDILE